MPHGMWHASVSVHSFRAERRRLSLSDICPWHCERSHNPGITPSRPADRGRGDHNSARGADTHVAQHLRSGRIPRLDCRYSGGGRRTGKPRLPQHQRSLCGRQNSPCLRIARVQGVGAFMSQQVLHPDDVSRVVRRYQQRIAEHGATFASLNSGDEKKQELRHRVLASALRGDSPSILEVGCGLAGFYSHLLRNHQNCSYRGYDIVPEYVAECRRNYPEADFDLRNVFVEGIEGVYDTIIMSQVLNNRYDKSDNMQVM